MSEQQQTPLLASLIEEGTIRPGKEYYPKVLLLKSKVENICDNNTQVVSLGVATGKPIKCMLLLGETGTGKTTFINCLVNYLCNIGLTSDLRLCLAEPDAKKDRKETESQTDMITVYKIHHMEGMRQNCDLIIIDTPGLADTRGKQQQNKTKKDLEAFFTSDHNIDDLHCLGIVATANTSKVNEFQKNIIQEVMCLLGAHASYITDILATHAVDDIKVGQVMKHAGVQFRDVFGFDNYVVFSPTHQKKKHLASRWEDWVEQFDFFFQKLNESQPINVKVLHHKKLFDISMRLLQEKVEEVARLLTNNQDMHNNQTKFSLQQEKNKVYRKEEIQESKVRQPTKEGWHAHNCTKCEKTCQICPPQERFTKVVGDYVDWAYEETEKAVRLPLVRNLSGALVGGTVGSVAGLGAGVANKFTTNCIFTIDKEKKCSVATCRHPASDHKQDLEKICVTHKKAVIENEEMKNSFDDASSRGAGLAKEIHSKKQEIENLMNETASFAAEMALNLKTVQDLTTPGNSVTQDPIKQLEEKVRQTGSASDLPMAVQVLQAIKGALIEFGTCTDMEVLKEGTLAILQNRFLS